MGKLIYKKRMKAVFILVQTAAIFVLVYCLFNIDFWMEDSYSLTELSKRYEESELFFRQVDSIIRDKIQGQENEELFEVGGETDLEGEIDIQSYGSASGGVQDMNTTYQIQALIDFYEEGGQAKLHEAIQAAVEGQKEDGRSAGERLDEQSAQLETIVPVTGIPLSECSRWYSDPSEFVLDMYIRLDEVSSDIYSRYQEYLTVQTQSWSSEAPSNLLYCIENTTTGRLYTNTGEETYEEAVKAAMAADDFVSLYEGERSFNIMVTNPDSVLNIEAEEWFMSERFVDTNEKVYLAVNPLYPVSDELQTYAVYFSKREIIVGNSTIGAVVCAVLLLTSFVLSVLGAGWQEDKCTPQLRGLDRIPTELACGLYMIVAVLYLMIFYHALGPYEILRRWGRLLWSGVAASAYLIFLSAVLSLVRRIRAKSLWTNSISRMLVRTWRQVTSARAASGQLLIFYLIFFVMNFLFLLLFGEVGIFLVFVLDMAVLLYLLRDMAGKQSIWEGIHRISEGNLQYKIDTSTLQGETYQMAKAVNEMGDGLQTAIEAIVKNERLKAELITNVSHDLKTPLTSIVNYVDLLKRENLQGERVQHYIEVLEQKSQRLKQLTEDLVEASKISSGNIELNMMRMQLQSMIWQAYGEFQERLEERGLTAVWELCEDPVFIMADGRQLWRILENLLGNIYKYALENTRIYIELRRDGQTAYLSLKNTSGEKLTVEAEELTGRFVRGDKSRATEGSGLGLSIAQNLVQLHGGTFELTVDGDLFKVTMGFPLASEENTPGIP